MLEEYPAARNKFNRIGFEDPIIYYFIVLKIKLCFFNK
jgi:hypothetical protein